MRSVIGFHPLPLVMRAAARNHARSARRPHRPQHHPLYRPGGWLWPSPLAVLISIEFTTPIWTAILAVTFLGERLSRPKLAAVVLGLIGVVVIVRPVVGSVDPGHLVVLGAAVCFGISLVLVKSLTRTDSVVRIIFWMLIIQSAVGLIPALYVWRTPSIELWPWILLIASTGMSSDLRMARALLCRRHRHFADGFLRAAVGADRLVALSEQIDASLPAAHC